MHMAVQNRLGDCSRHQKCIFFAVSLKKKNGEGPFVSLPDDLNVPILKYIFLFFCDLLPFVEEHPGPD